MSASLILGIQAGYFFISGIWPLIHMKSFEAITGPKTDHWLVQTVGALVLVSAVLFAYCVFQNRISPEIALLALLQALALGSVDVVFVLKKRISRIYLADAIFEAVFVIYWSCNLKGIPS